MDKKNQLLFNAILAYLDVKENRVLKDGLSISDTINDVFGEPYIKNSTLNCASLTRKN